MSTDTSTRASYPRKYRPQHWLIELIDDGERKRTVLLEGSKRNITFYIRNNTEYLMPFYRAMWKMADSMVGELQMSGKMLSCFESNTSITSEIIDKLIVEYENDELIDMFNVQYKPNHREGPVFSVNLSRLPQSWNTRPRRRTGAEDPKIRRSDFHYPKIVNIKAIEKNTTQIEK
ncbi:unnamed protein product [marine sediment metagenome]|uniref:Uncharacterized protein n=1 Tax=marine sediment metagenome TaxID=412755 RepID=X0YFN1_9ZZZZ